MFVSHILAKIRSHLMDRATVNELSKLSDHELDDLGIKRFQLKSVARRDART